ncbi:hypothetical protein HRI_001343800 [Hibiscus trionum]|uniref:RING-type E3 ubiquitin transferase n=1 Tax=Hibiscus trionum TaxID=183268 RepID=A0A9W7LVK7_HIBTR|nr:hypothetical protein HRI_001343800 [Hibiscus trionum]
MQMDSGSWYANRRTWYHFDKWIVEFTKDDVPQDYEEEVHSPQLCGRFRYCHALLDLRNDPDPTVLCNMFLQKLFEEWIGFVPWDHEVPEEFRGNRGSEIFDHIDSVCRANEDVVRLLIVVKFGVFKVHDDSYHDCLSDDNEIDEEIGFVPASNSSIEALEDVSDLGPEFECMICLEEGEKKGKRMPCGHAFHVGCIQEWLEKNNLCPLCRYAMPHDS